MFSQCSGAERRRVYKILYWWFIHFGNRQFVKNQVVGIFEKGQAMMAQALKWRMTAFVTRTLLQTFVAEQYIVEKLQRGDFESWENFKTKVLL